MTFIEIEGQKRSRIVNYSMAIRNDQKITVTMMTFIEVKGQQRSNAAHYVLWLAQ